MLTSIVFWCWRIHFEKVCSAETDLPEVMCGAFRVMAQDASLHRVYCSVAADWIGLDWIEQRASWVSQTKYLSSSFPSLASQFCLCTLSSVPDVFM